MFDATISKQDLECVVNTIGGLVDEAGVRAMPDRLLIEVVDPAHVAMASMTKKAGCFEKYSADDAEFIKFHQPYQVAEDTHVL